MNSNEHAVLFDAIVRPHLASALHLAYWLMRNRADAEDVVQDACIRAYRAIHTFAGGSSRTWVLAIVRNTALTALGRRKTMSFVHMDELDVDARSQIENGGILNDHWDATPEADLIAKSDEARLEAIISALPPEFRETLVLRDMQRMSYKDVAEVTGVPVGTVMSRLSRARSRIVTALKEDVQ